MVEGEGDSDVEGSQVSLPQSYTLPNAVAKERGEQELRGSDRSPPSRFYLPSTNSSDDGEFHLRNYCSGDDRRIMIIFSFR